MPRRGVASAVLRRLVIPLFAIAASCAPHKREMPSIPIAASDSPATATAPSQTPARESAPNTPPAPTSPAKAPHVSHTTLGGISITAVAFDSRSHRLVVADQAAGPGASWPDAKTAAASRSGLAAVNGGFFTPEGAPLGLVVSGGKRSGFVNRASSLGAGFYADGGTPSLLRRESWTGNAAEALQSGPFLIDRGKPVGGLSDASSTARTILGWDGGTGWFIARSGACSLASLAQALNGASLGGVKALTVLNLDGGRSSDLWVSPSVQGGPVSERPFWNKPVRNFLVLVPRR